MKNSKRGKATPPVDPSDTLSSSERRRLGRIVHDERGNARVEWVTAPTDTKRVALSLEETQPIAKPDAGYDPYRKGPRPLRRNDPSARPAKRDLRRLSEWIKQMRSLDARRQQGDDDQE
jgi:hypothetical protein